MGHGPLYFWWMASDKILLLDILCQKPTGRPGRRGDQKIATKNNPMKPRKIQEMIRIKETIERGTARPASVWEVRPDGKGGFTRKSVKPKAFQRAQKTAWDKSIPATRQRLGLSQAQFARLLGI